jgi:putative oxidoreductase
MANVFQPNAHDLSDSRSRAGVRSSLLLVPAARFLFSLIFIVSGVNHFTSGSVSYGARAGIPLADILVPVSGLLIVIGGVSVLFGVHARVGAALILLFLAPTTILMHDFWNVADPVLAQQQLIHFLKNLGLAGGALLIFFYGAGPVSLDQRK